ncbi:MFS transporter [Nocardioides flavus (ex Wang et al. 2016)]|uniref:MFS transporter n=1 Tax=Nocardioides flavus (ex Wang et al. 2016) TaxID=2058780 RepID=A0ABQ3HFI2_9ACTN|nr:MFS transporter [Nocardioides flavus (ex Wang et al. 2016)]GHE14868.1 MFS transporter [Nocardioides flavus (ex Wang et al. 2016)]
MTSAHDTSATTADADDSRRVSLLLGLLFGLAGMGSSSAAVALAMLGDDLGVSAGLAAWTISLYVLMLAVTTALYGRISDLVGVRGPLLAGLVLMSIGALVAAVAPTFELLLGARMVQGAGAAAVPTLGVTILSAKYSGEVRGLAFGRLAGVAAAVSCLGPLIGGLVEAAYGWRAVMALPILGALVVPLLWRALPTGGSGARLDVVGAVVVALTAAGMVLLVQSPSAGLLVAAIGAALLVLGVPAVRATVRRRPDGFLPVEVIRNATVVRSAVAASSVPASWFAMLIALPAVLLGEGWQAWQVGLAMVPSAVVALLVPQVTGPLLNRIGPSRALAVSALVASAALLVATAGAGWSSAAVLVAGIILVTFAFGLGQPALSAVVGDAVHQDVRGVALGVSTLLFLIGGSVGSAVVAGISGPLGMPAALLVLAVLPLLGLLVLAPTLRAEAVAD